MEQKYLILGATGLVGRAIGRQLNDKCEWSGTYFRRWESGLLKLNVTSADSLREVFDRVRPSYVINCTSLAGGVDFCESNPKLATQLYLGANILAGGLCNEYDARMVLISTDYVFDGKNTPYQEDDKPNPLNVYGRLKLEAEQWLRSHVFKHTIVRTTNVFGWDPETVTPNYMMSLYRAIKANKQFRAPSFLWGNPTYVDDLASAIIELCSTKIDGVFHVVGSSFISRFDWAIKACQATGWDESLVVEVSNIPDNTAPRPLRPNLDTRKFRRLCQTKLSSVDDGIKRFLASIREE